MQRADREPAPKPHGPNGPHDLADPHTPAPLPLPAAEAPFRVALVEPEIPPNTGNIARLCLSTGSELHLVHPLGFRLDDRQLRRAGMDYWHRVKITHHPSLAAFEEHLASANGRAFFFSTKAGLPFWETAFHPGDFLVFGRETRGLPEGLLARRAGSVIGIPMAEGERSLNLATAAGIALYEALRQSAARPCGPGATFRDASRAKPAISDRP